MIKKGLFWLIALTVLVAGCETDLDVNADWKDVTIVYGLINPADDIHYLRVNKGFLGEEDALVMAQVQDSLEYGEELSIKLEEYKNGNLIRSVTDSAVLDIEKDPGIFANPSQKLYAFNMPNIDEDATYKVVITNGANGNVITAETPVINDFDINRPKSNQVGFYNENGVDLTIAEWESAEDGKVYEVKVRFWYWLRNNTTKDSTLKFVDWPFLPQNSKSISGGESMTIRVQSSQWHKYIASVLEAPPAGHVRIIDSLDFMFAVGGEDLSTFMDVNKPSIGIVQEKPEFTNVSGGIGIFSTRYYKDVTKRALNRATKDELISGSDTQHLLFIEN